MDYLNSIRSKVESTVDQFGGTEWEKKVKSATSLDNWPTKSSDLLEIAQATNDYTAYREIMPILWKRLGSDSKSWRVIYKTLILLDYIIRHGSDRSVEESKEHTFHLRQLAHFHFIDTDDKDRGTGIREKSKEITELLNDDSRLRELRKDSEKNRSKIVGLSSTGAMSSLEGGPRSGGYNDEFGSGGAGGNRNYESYGSEDRWKNNDEDSGSRRKKRDEDNGEDSGEKKKKKKEKKVKTRVTEENEEPEHEVEEKKPKKKGKKKAHKDEEHEEHEEPVEKDFDEEEVKPKTKSKKGKGKKKATDTVSGVAISASGKLAPPPGTGASSSGADFEPFASAPTAASTATVASNDDFDFTSNLGGVSSGPVSSSGFDFNPRSAPVPAPVPSGNLLDMFGSSGGSSRQPAPFVDLLGGGAAAPVSSAQSIDLFGSSSSSSSSSTKPAAVRVAAAASGFDDDFGDFRSSGAGGKKAPAEKKATIFDDLSSNLVQLNLKDKGADQGKQSAGINVVGTKSMAEMRGANQTMFLPGLDLPQQQPRAPQPGMGGPIPPMGPMGYAAGAQGGFAPPAGAYGAAPYGMPNPAFGRGYPAPAAYGMAPAGYGASPYGAPNPYGAAAGGFPGGAMGYGGFPQQRPVANPPPTSANNIFF